MNIVMPEYVAKNKTLNYGAMILYGILASINPPEGVFECTNQRLVEITGANIKTVQHWLKQLKTLGYIKTSRKYRRTIEITDKEFLKKLKTVV